MSRRAWPHPATGTERTRPHDPGWKGQHPESESQKWDLKEHVEVSHVSRLCNHQQRLLAQTKSKNGGNIRAPEGGETSRLSQEQDPILLGARGVKGGDGDQGGAKSAMNRRGKSKDSGRRGQGAGREDDDEGRLNHDFDDDK